MEKFQFEYQSNWREKQKRKDDGKIILKMQESENVAQTN